ncbi:coiled-coil domain-containing protein [Bacillus solitudinis]|uniref:hypothetical protein n=1 Tax=Bacillus solitudinis TaxID=2014074 RepID=UPI001D0D4DDC|nr:hypothetical protein [Bacillus solitudinis]
MEKKKCQSVCTGLWVGGVVALSVVLLKKEWRSKVFEEAEDIKQQSSEMVSFIRENRQGIFNQVKTTAREVSNVVQDITEDIKKLTSTVKHLKERSEEIVKATKEAAEEVKQLKK